MLDTALFNALVMKLFSYGNVSVIRTFPKHDIISLYHAVTECVALTIVICAAMNSQGIPRVSVLQVYKSLCMTEFAAQ